ncbi:CPBP family intramembrane glutamic endopeptidase [Microbacterium sp. GCS4]|uniref:CPBP family intramembrane glutamic endopeptidase n=1 Tax=Microbacterium sp. GCS4 TaxID=1692239 RepID=UPI00067FAC76|nr:type II CAAX endopeptidase family protein [Microbacterium sp. GCS4]KNY07564.1 metal-dependent membrane protease [Microbacterium sp. GCS4]
MTVQDRVRWPAVIAFVVLACGLAWLVALPLWLGDGLAEPLAPLILVAMMLTPAVAALIVTFALGYPARGARLRFLGLWPLRPAKRVIGLLLVGWLGPPVVVVLGILIAVALGFVQLDFTFAALSAQLEQALPPGTPMPPVGVIVFSQLAFLPLGALLNSIPALGEELGWRGWLLTALRPLGTWPTLLLSGVIWGLWHSPVILLGYNFGRTDASGVLFMTVGCVAWGVLLGWLRLRSASIWPAVVAHGSLNAAAGLVLIFAAGQPDQALAGPLGVAGWIAAAVVIAALLVTGQFRRQPELGVATPKADTPASPPAAP